MPCLSHQFLLNKLLSTTNILKHYTICNIRLKTKIGKHHFHIKLPYQKPILRHIEWWVQNRPITKNGVLPTTTLLFWKICFSLRTSYRDLIWCTNGLNAHIPTFCKCWSAEVLSVCSVILGYLIMGWSLRDCI